MTGQTSIPQPVLRGKLSEQVKFSDLPIPVQQRLYEEQLATFKAEEAAAARLNKQLKASKAQRKTDQVRKPKVITACGRNTVSFV